jgi:hypothetical protein
MNDMDTIDRAWRDGFERGAPLVDNMGVRERVDRRVVVRRRRRVAGRAIAAVCAVVLIGSATLAMRPRSHPQPVGPVQKVAVTDAPGGSLGIVFPSTGTSEIHLKPGSYEFDITADAPGHALGFASGPEVQLEHAGAVVPLRVTLTPGTHVLQCSIPGHAAAGEKAMVVVG